MISDLSFIRSIVSLCRQSLSGDKMAIKSAEDQMSMLVKSATADTEVKIALIFKIILAPQALSAVENKLSDDELCGLKLASSEVQLWAAIFLKNYIKANFDASETFGGVSESVRNIIKSFLTIATLNGDQLGVQKQVAAQLQRAFLLISDRDFPESMEHVLLLINYCHISDISKPHLVETLSARLQVEMTKARSVNLITPNMEMSSSLTRSLAESQSNLHVKYADYLVHQIKNYSNLMQSIQSYNKILSTNNYIEISRSYFEFFKTMLEGVKNMCNLTKSVTLKEIEMNKFTQAASFLFCHTILNTHTANPLTQSYEVNSSPSDSLLYFDDRNMFTDPKLFQYGVKVPDLGINQHNVHLLLSPSLYINEMYFNKSYFKNKIKCLHVFRNIMKKYKSRQYDNDTLSELKIVLTLSDVHLLYLFKYAMFKFSEYYNFFRQQRNSFSMNCLAPVILDLLEIVMCVTKIFCYVHSIDLPESFEDNAQLYFSGLIKLIHFNDPGIQEKDGENIVVNMKVAIMKLFRYYAERYQEVFHPFVFTCIDDVVKVCRMIGQDSAHDKLCCAALDFLAASSSTHWGGSQTASARTNPFMNNSFLAEIIQSIIVPNIGFRESDLYLLDDCPLEFVQREIESTTTSSRRFSSITFLKKLVSGYGQVCQQIINQVAKNVASNNDYKLKELYLQLIICLNFKDVSGDFNVLTYFTDYLKNEFVLLSQNPLSQDKMLIILAIIKYIYTFYPLFPEMELISLVPYLVMYLKNSHEAVRSLACEAISRFLTKLRMHKQKLKTCLLQALEHLVALMRTTGRAGNEFYAKCTMKIFLFLREDVRESGMIMIDIVISLIKSVSDNPVNPAYNHFLFECLSILLRIHLQSTMYSMPSMLGKIEEALIPTLGLIIQQEMHPFIPYSLQVLCLMLKYATKSSTTYIQLLNHLVCIETWKVSNANAQGNIKLLVCFFEKHKLFENEIMTNMEKILNIFHFCLMHRKLSKHSLDLLNGIIKYLPINYYVNFLKSIVTVLLTYIHGKKTGDTLRDVVTSMSFLTLYLHLQKYEHTLVDILESIQSGISSNFIQMMYLPNVKKATTLEAKKVHAMALSKIATSSQVQTNAEMFRMLMQFLNDLISGENVTLEMPKEEETNTLDAFSQADLNFDVSYVKLQAVYDSKNKLLENNVNVEGIMKEVLIPISGTMRANMSLSKSFGAILSLIN